VSWVNADGVSGYNVETENAEALAGAFEKILSDPERYEELSKGARQRYETMYTREKMVDKCLKLYNDMLRKTVLLPNELFFKEVEALLGEGKQVRIPVKGKSMRPFVQNEDTVVLVSASNRSIRWGEIVLARTTTGNIVLHRVVYKKKNRLWLAGDAHARQREHTTVEDVLAVTIAAYRNRKKLRLDSFWWRCAVVFWFLAMPARGYILRMCDLLKRKKNRK
jgi:pentatricopeptide repeat protein